jgi:hypothetical protein
MHVRVPVLHCRPIVVSLVACSSAFCLIRLVASPSFFSVAHYFDLEYFDHVCDIGLKSLQFSRSLAQDLAPPCDWLFCPSWLLARRPLQRSGRTPVFHCLLATLCHVF